MASAALLMDGGYVIKRLQRIHGRFPTAAAVRSVAAELITGIHPTGLYRIFFYHANPYCRSLRRPLTGEMIRFDGTAAARYHSRLMQELEGSDDFAVRRGEVMFRGWRIRRAVQNRLQREPEQSVAVEDFVPDFGQKGVDMRIGLDIAALALKRLVDTIVLVTGDTDMVPAMRFARREGLRVGFSTLGVRRVHPELRAHADFVLDWKPASVAGATSLASGARAPAHRRLGGVP